MKKNKYFFFFAIASVLGLCSVVLPSVLLPGIKSYDAPLFPLVRTGIEGFSILSLILLIISGGIVGFLEPKFAWLWGIGTGSLFPLLAIAEMIVDRHSHNLWPFEFLFYGLMIIPGVIGAYIGAFIARRIRERVDE